MADKQRMKGITCCGDCVYYDWKKHKCSRGASVETDAREHFYDDCPIPDVEQLDEKEIRAKAIDEFAERYKKENVAPKVFERIFRMVQLGESDFSEVAEYINSLYCDLADEVAEQMKAGGMNG